MTRIYLWIEMVAGRIAAWAFFKRLGPYDELELP